LDRFHDHAQGTLNYIIPQDFDAPNSSKGPLDKNLKTFLKIYDTLEECKTI
jgi:hypothetical protein